LSVAHDAVDGAKHFLHHQEIERLRKAAVLVENWRARNDLFEVDSVHWQTFWQSANPSLLSQAKDLLSELDSMALPDNQTDNLEQAIKFYNDSRNRILGFLRDCERQDGDRT